MKTVLHNHWTLTFTHPDTGQTHSIPATVPGNTEMDLMREGLIDNPMPHDDPHAMRKWERVDDWTYETAFDAPEAAEDETVRLTFEGINTLAEVTLNGQPLLECDNMFLPYEIDVTDQLKPTGNALCVRIHSPVLRARAYDVDVFQTQQEFRQSGAYLRMARHMWGWDNAPRLFSAGLWRPVVLETLPPIRFSDVYVFTRRVEADTVAIGCNWTFETPDADLSEYQCVFELSEDGHTVFRSDLDTDFTSGRALFKMPRDHIKLWWPRGHGEPNLYDAVLRLYRGDESAAEWRTRMGIRDIELLRTETTNEQGVGEFVFICNGEKIYIRGTNWKPRDALHARAHERVRPALDMCLDLHCNMVRIWGGGIYEDHPFYDFCDEHGLLVWQDFMFACEFPPRDPWFLANVQREAEAIVRRLRNHASLAVWCGDNENDLAFTWNSMIPNTLRPSDNIVSRHTLKDAVLSYDPYRPYVPSSPYIADEVVEAARHDRSVYMTMNPEQHLYTWNDNFRDFYRASQAHFVAETGPFVICAMSQSPEIIEQTIPRARRLWDRPIERKDYVLGRHQTDAHFLTWKQVALERLSSFFDRDFTLDTWEELALGVNIYCADIFKFSIEYGRSLRWRKTGVLWWSLMDMWPMMFNYSVVDFAMRPKQPCYHWIKQSQQPFCLMAMETEDGNSIELFAANDTRETREGPYRITLIDPDGRETEGPVGTLRVEANSMVKLDAWANDDARACWILHWETGRETGYNHFIHGRPPFNFDAYRQWCEAIEKRKGHA